MNINLIDLSKSHEITLWSLMIFFDLNKPELLVQIRVPVS